MKKSLTLKTVALAMASIYLCQQVLFAQELPFSNEAVKAPLLTISPKIAQAELPPELGTLVEQHGENPSVMLIQDAHGHFDQSYNCLIDNQDCYGKIVAHHILSWREYPELRHDINNGVTLCHFHHPKKRDDEKRLSNLFSELIKN